MFDCRGLPAAAEDLAGVTIELPQAKAGQPDSGDVEGLVVYLRREAPGGVGLTRDQLVFERSVDLGDAEYWVWSFDEPDGGQRAYAFIRRDRDGDVTLGYDADYYGLSPVHFAVGDYCGYW